MSVLTTNQRIIQFCKTHKNFDVDKILLMTIDMIQPFLSATEYRIDDIQNKMDLNNQKLQQNLGALFEQNMNKMFKESFVGENSITRVIVENVKNTTNPVLNAQLNNITNNQINTQNKINQLEKTIYEGGRTETDPVVNAHLNTITTHQINTQNKINQLEKTVCDSTRSDPAISNKLNEISSNQQNTDYKIQQLQKIVSGMDNNLNAYLEKMKIQKGIVTETKFQLLLEHALPGSIIERVPSMNQKGRMDINIRRPNQPDVLIDLKDYSNTVPASEVLKFENDIIVSSNHGILVSPYSNISGKINFQLSIINGKIAIYLSNLGLDATDIVKAIQVIYFLNGFLEEKQDGIHLTTAMVDIINTSINENTHRVANIKSHLNLALTECNNLLFNTIKTVLSLKSQTFYVCEKCDKTFDTARSLGGHKRFCK